MEQKRETLVWMGLAAASSLLAIEPLKWLVRSWHDPSYQSHGALYCLVLAGLVGLSLKSSPPKGINQTGRVFVLFFFAAALRLLGQILAINIVSALALAADVFAIAAVLRLDKRRLALSPFWLSIFFLFAMPLGAILQRIAGYPLQMVSAEVACHMLSPAFADLICEGVRLKVNGVDVLVDLPCSGATGLLLMISLWAFLNVIYRPALVPALKGLCGVILFTLLGNALRISLLAGGLALGLDTMAPILHAGIGIVTIGLSAAVTLWWYQPAPASKITPSGPNWHLPKAAQFPLVALAIIAALSIISAPKRPIDVSGPVEMTALPTQLNGQRAQKVALSAAEEHYFTAFGGVAQKASYGPLGLNVVKTNSPLRHLHAPATCLRAMGFTVTFLGTRFDPIPTTTYKAVSPDGAVWMVDVSYVSGDGRIAPGVGEAVWSWLTGSSRNWQSIQRITPAHLPDATRQSYELAVLAALDLT